MHKPLLSFLLSSTLLATGALAQTAQPVGSSSGAPAPAEQQPSATPVAVTDLAKIIKIESKPQSLTPVPENEPIALDLTFVEVPDIPKALTDGVTANAYARYVVVEDTMIGQLVLSGVSKKDRTEPLDAEHFVAQFDLDRPELSTETDVVIDGDHAELLDALKRLNEEEKEEEQQDGDKETSSKETPERTSSGGRVGTNAAENKDAAGYTNPEPLAAFTATETPQISVEVVTDGCDIRVDLGQLVAIQQSKVVTIEGDKRDETPCEDGNDRYPLSRSYASCQDTVDLDRRVATAQYQLYYVNAGGTRNQAAECQPDEDKTYGIVEDTEACPVSLDYASLRAVPQAKLVYVNDTNAVAEVRGCEASETKAAVPLVPTTDGCTIRHAFAESQSHQQGRHQYTLDGVTWDAGACADDGTRYPHAKIYEDLGGRRICEPIIDKTSGRVTEQYRTQITVKDKKEYITACTPEATAAIQRTRDGCEDPATWTHDLSAGVSYAHEREYYMRGSEREYLSECKISTDTYPHQVSTVGWQMNDGQLTAQPISKVTINAPTGVYTVAAAEVLPGAASQPYTLANTVDDPTGDRLYEGCNGFYRTERMRLYQRPDGSGYSLVIGAGANTAPEDSCSRWQETKTEYVRTSGQLNDFVHELRLYRANGSQRSWANPSYFSDITDGPYVRCEVRRWEKWTVVEFNGWNVMQNYRRQAVQYPDGRVEYGGWTPDGGQIPGNGFRCTHADREIYVPDE